MTAFSQAPLKRDSAAFVSHCASSSVSRRRVSPLSRYPNTETKPGDKAGHLEPAIEEGSAVLGDLNLFKDLTSRVFNFSHQPII